MNFIRSILLFISLFTCAYSHAQVNLVLNPSLERYSICPSTADEITNANHWSTLDTGWAAPDWAHDLDGVPEYCNACYIGGAFGVPSSGMYYFNYPHTGNGMAMVYMLSGASDALVAYKRDYMQGHLYSPLTSGQQYCVTFYVVLCNNSSDAISNIGAYLDNGTIDTTHFPQMPQTHVTPQILASSIITDVVNWTKVQGSFVANGTERLITIGNFSDLAHTTYRMPLVGGYTWYLVDDISLMRSDAIAKAGPDRIITSSHDTVMVGDTLDSYLPTYWYAGGRLVDSNKGGFMIHVDTTTTFVVSLDVCGHVTYDTMTIAVSTEMSTRGPNLNNVTVFPNPASTELTIEHANGAAVVMYDVVGREVKRVQVTRARETLDVSGLVSGVYVVQISKDGEKRNVRVVKE